jgi:hypothetical protein
LPPNDARVQDARTFRIIDQSSLEEFAVLKDVSSASDLLKCVQSYPLDNGRWAFRGHSKASWKLQPSIERLANEQGISPHVERYVERQFKRHAHHYLQNLPKDENVLEWLALMQHHGAPTRLLDWTKSVYVAAFFAAECADLVDRKPVDNSLASGRKATRAKEPEPFVIWAVDRESVRSEALTMLGLDGPDGDNDLSSIENFRKIYRDNPPEDLYLTVPVQPYRLNERLTIQQGLFLCPNNNLIGFERSLKSLLHHANKKNGTKIEWLYKLTVEPSARLDVLGMLNQMNINRATLYPGLDGFARSLHTETELLSQKDWYKSMLSDFIDT